MLTISFEEIKDAIVTEYASTVRIDIDNIRLEFDEIDAKYITEQLEYHFYGNTHDELRTRLEDNIRKLREEIRTLRRENTALRFGEVVYRGEVR